MRYRKREGEEGRGQSVWFDVRDTTMEPKLTPKRNSVKQPNKVWRNS